MACTIGVETNEKPAPDHECMHIYIYIYMCVCVCIYIYIYIYIYTHTHIDLVCMPQAHNTSYIANNNNINNIESLKIEPQ